VKKKMLLWRMVPLVWELSRAATMRCEHACSKRWPGTAGKDVGLGLGVHFVKERSERGAVLLGCESWRGAGRRQSAELGRLRWKKSKSGGALSKPT